MHSGRAPSHRAYPPRYAPDPTYTRHHHSYYDECGPLPPPALHHRHSHHDDPYYTHDGRSPTAPSPTQLHEPYTSTHYAHAAHARHPHSSHHASFSSTGSSASSFLSMHNSVAHPTTVVPAGSRQQPTYRGHIKTTKDAILLLAACDVQNPGVPGLPPPRRVNRRLLDSECTDLICSGSFFVWDEKEAGMRRWTDGKCWSASRVSGFFLTYRELETRKKPSSSTTRGPTSTLYKAEGLIKQSFSMTTTSGRKLHVISYHTKRDVREGLLRRVSKDLRFVGESAGEWGLTVDEGECADPTSRAGDLPPGVNSEDLKGCQSPPGPAHAEPVDLRTSSGQAVMPSRNASFHQARNLLPVSASFLDERASMNRGFFSPSSRELPLVSLRETAFRRDLDAHVCAYRNVKGEPIQSSPYTSDMTPLHPARALLPIRTLPVDSKYAEPSVRRGSNDTPLEVSPHDSGLLYGRKRSYQSFRDARSSLDGSAEPWPVRPRLHHLRSSSLSGAHTGAHDALATIRLRGRVGSDDERVSQLRSTHDGPAPPSKEQYGSAVRALLSLRSDSSSSDDSKLGSVSQSPATTALSSAEADKVKPTFSRMDRAALDRFSVRI